ncbi:MAG: TonB-dependent receptor [Gammaproteobacteria bacterium]|nr:TonB-dependent receptor [Gammaproteobacteria bacterium]
MKFTYLLRGGGLLLLSAGLTPIYAEPDPEILVTATRTAVAAYRIPASSTTITRDEIEKLQVRTLPDLLKGIAGIDLTDNGGAGKVTSVFLRGTESDHVLVLIDGIRVGSATLGTTAFQHLPIEQIERVEIVRGPRASQWGSEAIGGVIHIFTRKGTQDTGHWANLGGGRYSTYTASGGVGGEVRNSHYSVSGSVFDTRGFDARQPLAGPFGFDQPDADGYENTAFQAQVGHEFPGGAELDAFALRASGTNEFDGSFEDQSDFVQQVLGVSASWKPTRLWRIGLRAGESRDETDNFAPGGNFSSRFDTRRREFSVQSDIEVAPDQALTFGLDQRRERVRSTSLFAEESRDNTGVFGQYFGHYGPHHVLFSLRNDDDDSFGEEVTGGAGWSYLRKEGGKIYLSYGTAFKTPSFNELFFPNFGNPDLDPETSESVELGIEGVVLNMVWSMRAYRTDIDALIVTVMDPTTGNFFPDNVNKARIDGVEFELAAELAGWDLSVAFSFVDPEDRETGKRLRRRAEETLRVDFTRDQGRWSFGGRFFAQGERFEDADNLNRLPGYATLDLFAEYRLHANLSLRAKLENVFNKQYEVADTFNSTNRNLFVSLAYRSR